MIVDGEKLLEEVAADLQSAWNDASWMVNQKAQVTTSADHVRSFLPRLSEFAPEAGEDVQEVITRLETDALALNSLSSIQPGNFAVVNDLTHAAFSCRKAAAFLLSQYSKIAALEKDARRYRWLRERYDAADMNYKDFGEGQAGRPVAIFSVTNPWPFSFDYELAAKLLDDAIDAASAEGGKDV